LNVEGAADGVLRSGRSGSVEDGPVAALTAPRHNRAVLYVLLAAMVLSWSANYIVAKFALREFPPLLLSTLRVTFAGLGMLPVYWWEQRRTPSRWELSDLPLLIGLGIFGVALNQMFFVAGLSCTSVAHAAIIIGTTPILVLLLAAMRHQERITARKAVGMAIALGGVALLKAFEVRPPDGRGPTWTGDFLIFLGGLTFALFTTYGKGATLRHSSITVNTFAYAGATLAVAPITVWQSWSFSFARVTLVGWSAIAFMALVSSIACYLIYYYALTHMMPSRVSAFSYLQAPIVAVMGVFTLGEHITLALVLSALVIFSGVFLTERG
jgi:drug/metabolite transporter (DMT)-like permease